MRLQPYSVKYKSKYIFLQVSNGEEDRNMIITKKVRIEWEDDGKFYPMKLYLKDQSTITIQSRNLSDAFDVVSYARIQLNEI